MIHIRSARARELRDVVRFALARPEINDHDLDAQVEAFITHVDPKQLPLEYQLVATDRGKLIDGCLALVAPGRTAMLFPPTVVDDAGRRERVLSLLDALRGRLAEGAATLLQCLVPPAHRADEDVLADAGFEYLADLVYLDRPVIPGARTRRLRESPELTWETYRPDNHAVFASIIEASYENSLDCPKLNGRRDIEDVVEGHRATGHFDASNWFLAHLNAQPAGVLLLARVPHRPAMEVVYTGVLPAARRQGIAEAMMRRALRRTEELGLLRVTLAVDAENTPARRLYEGLGFAETGGRRAWIQWI